MIGLKTTALLIPFLWLVKSLKNLKIIIIGLLFTLRNMVYFLIFSMASILLEKLEKNLIELLGLDRSGAI